MLKLARSIWQVSGNTSLSLQSLRGFSVGATSDYALVQKQATEVGVSIPLPPKEAGYAAGIPLDTYNRLVRNPPAPARRHMSLSILTATFIVV